MHCVNNGNQIKEEAEIMIDCDMHAAGVLVDDVDLGPHIEIRRIVKNPELIESLPPTIVYTSQSNSRKPPPIILSPPSPPHCSASIHQPSTSSHFQQQQQQEQQPQQQRVQVIKDGRNYDKPTIEIQQQQQQPLQKHIYSHSNDSAINETKSTSSAVISAVPNVLHDNSNSNSPKKNLFNRSVNVISNATSTSLIINRDTSANNINGGSIVFRTPVVSSTSTPMRPPPPPPPPKIKNSSNEEPSSSIPDLGEFFLLYIV